MVEIEDCELRPVLLALDNRFSNVEFLGGSLVSIGVEVGLNFGLGTPSRYVTDSQAFVNCFNTGVWKDCG